MEVWEGVLGRGDGVNEGDVPDAEWLPLMKSGGCNLERGFPPRLLGVVAANWDPIILWSCEVSRSLSQRPRTNAFLPSYAYQTYLHLIYL